MRKTGPLSIWNFCRLNIEWVQLFVSSSRNSSRASSASFASSNNPRISLPPTLSLLSVVIVLASLPLLQFIDLSVVELSRYGVLSDPDIDGFDEVAKYSGAEKEDVVTRHAGVIDVGSLVLLEENTQSHERTRPSCCLYLLRGLDPRYPQCVIRPAMESSSSGVKKGCKCRLLGLEGRTG